MLCQADSVPIDNSRKVWLLQSPLTVACCLLSCRLSMDPVTRPPSVVKAWMGNPALPLGGRAKCFTLGLVALALPKNGV